MEYRALARMIDDNGNKWYVRIADYKTREEAIEAGERFKKIYENFKYAQAKSIEIFRVSK